MIPVISVRRPADYVCTVGSTSLCTFLTEVPSIHGNFELSIYVCMLCLLCVKLVRIKRNAAARMRWNDQNENVSTSFSYAGGDY